MRVLVVEDEVRLAATLRDLLELNGYTVDICHDGESGLDNALTSIYDVILLDVMLPKLDGFTVLRRLRAEGSTTPVLMLTARSELTDRVNGLDSGADYYLTKPFEPKELLACIRAITRTQAEVDTKLSAGNITLDRSTFELASPTGSFRLANKEFQMMELLMANPHHIISAERFLEKIWGFDNEAEINVVWVYISYLRKKLAALHADITIKSSRNAGYSLEEEV